MNNMKGQGGGIQLFAYAVLTTFVFASLFGVYAEVENSDMNLLGEVEGITVETFTANESFSEPENGTVLENTCDSNGQISPQANSSCTWEVEYDTSEFQYGNPIELRYGIDIGDGSGTWTIETFKGEETEALVQEDITDTTLITTEELDFERDNKDEVTLTYTLEDPDEVNTTAPELYRSELDIDGDDTTFEMGITEGFFFLFTILVFFGISAIVLWRSF